ncbi:hypothetical protein BU14_0840s0003 [Porphyra umbilicalis]|uniref:Uncharacterized protein n=1 Tax=Porphyra umbilicalis TaxID=2786 RepID=A0A1X6NNT6_PORUM|nr:hypothetical protein BU14_0840s0003 [Porphyra umbilicalis]|eukprot:OSX70235.1 hypothetical protein BU14_0840s0003 [Porphyra umbilicalis]
MAAAAAAAGGCRQSGGSKHRPFPRLPPLGVGTPPNDDRRKPPPSVLHAGRNRRRATARPAPAPTACSKPYRRTTTSLYSKQPWTTPSPRRLHGTPLLRAASRPVRRRRRVQVVDIRRRLGHADTQFRRSGLALPAPRQHPRIVGGWRGRGDRLGLCHQRWGHGAGRRYCRPRRHCRLARGRGASFDCPGARRGSVDGPVLDRRGSPSSRADAARRRVYRLAAHLVRLGGGDGGLVGHHVLGGNGAADGLVLDRRCSASDGAHAVDRRVLGAHSNVGGGPCDAAGSGDGLVLDRHGGRHSPAGHLARRFLCNGRFFRRHVAADSRLFHGNVTDHRRLFRRHVAHHRRLFRRHVTDRRRLFRRRVLGVRGRLDDRLFHGGSLLHDALLDSRSRADEHVLGGHRLGHH